MKNLIFVFIIYCIPGNILSENILTLQLIYYATSQEKYITDTRAIKNPNITGALFQIIWSRVERENGKYDFSELDNWMKPWHDAGKKTALRIMWITSGYWADPWCKHPTPDWVWKEGAVKAYHNESKTEIPLIWDPVYKKYAFRFMKKLTEKYNSNSSIIFIDITPGAETNPFRFGTILRHNPDFADIFKKLPASNGYVYSKILWGNTVREYINTAVLIFTDTKLLVTLNAGGFREDGNRLEEFGNYCADKGLLTGQNGIKGSSYSKDSPVKNLFLKWSIRCGTFFEMHSPTDVPGQGTLAEVFAAAKRVNASYLNIYPQDVLKATAGTEVFNAEYEKVMAQR
ncbi:MAG TPA: hypothetical protein DC049_12500 [Spirochaetia bacterium]|nr:hypothetical protein [Spirochaetia bacterium]